VLHQRWIEVWAAPTLSVGQTCRKLPLCPTQKLFNDPLEIGCEPNLFTQTQKDLRFDQWIGSYACMTFERQAVEIWAARQRRPYLNRTRG
jgi:hypothetical protein